MNSAIELFDYFKILQWQKARKMPDYDSFKYRFDYDTRATLHAIGNFCAIATIPAFIFAYLIQGINSDNFVVFYLASIVALIALVHLSIKHMFSLVYFLRVAPYKMRVKRYLKNKGLQHFVRTLSDDNYVTQSMTEAVYYKNLILKHHQNKDCSEDIYSMLLNYYKYAGQKIKEDKEKNIFNQFFNEKLTYMD